MTQLHSTLTPLPASATPMIELRGVTKRYLLGEVAVTALRNVTLRIERGEYLAVMGSSGSGKSTLLQLLGALDTPTEGDFLLEGQNITHLGDAALARLRGRHFGFVFQSYNLFPELSAVENVALPLVYAGVPGRERRERARARLATVGLSDREGHRPAQLSGGQQQRVAIARALVTEPSLLLADEPTGNLSREGGAGILDLLGELHADGTSIVMVTHDEAVGAHAERLVQLEDGEVVADRVTR